VDLRQPADAPAFQSVVDADRRRDRDVVAEAVALMARVRIAVPYLLEALFPGVTPLADVRGVSFDADRRLVLLDMEGPDLPPGDVECTAIVTVRQESYRFEVDA
jgi:hypothetical protein